MTTPPDGPADEPADQRPASPAAAPSAGLAVELAGETVLLHPDRALLWPARRTLVVADLHFGKDDAFRRAGIALPAGAARTDVGRLAGLLAAHAVARLVVLGDFFHARPHADDAFFAEFAAFRASHRSLALEVVAGNHDRHGGDTLDEIATWHSAGLDDGPFAFRHEPDAVPGRYVLAGHLHPVIQIGAFGGDRARLPVFWLRPTMGVLPAFGSLTGGARILPRPGDRTYAAAGRRVIELPAAD
jgi:DNA ligase-associated metallophosphoesterase